MWRKIYLSIYLSISSNLPFSHGLFISLWLSLYLVCFRLSIYLSIYRESRIGPCKNSLPQKHFTYRFSCVTISVRLVTKEGEQNAPVTSGSPFSNLSNHTRVEASSPRNGIEPSCGGCQLETPRGDPWGPISPRITHRSPIWIKCMPFLVMWGAELLSTRTMSDTRPSLAATLNWNTASPINGSLLERKKEKKRKITKQIKKN